MDILLAFASVYLSLMITKLWITRKDHRFVARNMVKYRVIELDEGDDPEVVVSKATRILWASSTAYLVVTVLQLLWHERLAFFMPYDRSELEHFAKFGFYPE